MKTREIFSNSHVKEGEFESRWICPECGHAHIIPSEPVSNCSHCGLRFDAETWHEGVVQTVIVTKTIHREATQESPDANSTV